jgi:hypothetical protein
MEIAFLKGLKHGLSSKYKYVIVADRGFGNQRFIEDCEELGFDYLIRLSSNKNIKEYGNLSNMPVFQGIKKFHILSWKRDVNILITSTEGVKEKWYLATNLSNYSPEDLIQEYKNRFKIEKVFQDLKSSGFDLEASKIKKYDRYKRLFCLGIMAHAIMVLIGNYMDENLPTLKKNSPLCYEILSVYSSLPKGLSLYISSEP